MRQCSEAQESQGRVPAALVHVLHSVMAKVSILQSMLGDDDGQLEGGDDEEEEEDEEEGPSEEEVEDPGETE